MMRNTVTLALISFLLLCAGFSASAQNFTVNGRDILKLANIIVKEAEVNFALPPAYIMPIAGTHDSVITAPMAFEMLAQTLALKQNSDDFPKTISDLKLSFTAAYAPEYEPASDQRRKIAVWSPELFGEKVPFVLACMPNTENVIPQFYTLADKNTLTAAQFTVAMAMGVKWWGETGVIPELLGVPAVLSPEDWENRDNPIAVTQPVTLDISINGINVYRKTDGSIPDAVSQPFCGSIQVGLKGSGPITSLKLSLDDQEICVYDKAGNYGYSLDSTKLTDGQHRLTISLTDEDNTGFLSMLPITVQNGRISSFTPAESDVLDAKGNG